MKILLSLLCACFFAIFFSSCQREINFDLPANPNPPTSADSTLLARFIDLDTTLPSGLDTIEQIFYSYDSQKRVKRCFSTDYTDTETIDYFYSGTDSLPFKTVSVWTNYGDIYRDTIFWSYMNGVVSKDSTIEYDITTSNQFFSTETVIYTPGGNNILLQSRIYHAPGPLAPVFDQWSGTIVQTRQNGDITMQDDTTHFHVIYTDRAHMEANYDNKINPFYRVETPYPILRKSNVQKNNVVEELSWDVPSSLYSHNFYTYTYRADGYPTSVKLASSLGGPGDGKGIFLYTR